MTGRLTIAVCFARPVFTAFDDSDARALIERSRAAGHQADALTLPSVNPPGSFSEDGALHWALIDLIAGGQRAIDVVVCVSPETMLLRHPNKVAWVREPWGLSIEESLKLVDRVVVSHELPMDAMQSGDDGDGPVVRARSIDDVLDVVCARRRHAGATR